MTGPQLHRIGDFNARERAELSPLIEPPWWAWSRVVRYGALLVVAGYLMAMAWR